MEFGEDAGDEAPDSEEHSHVDSENTEFRRHFDEDKMRPSEDIHGEADKMRLSMFSQELILNRKPGALDQALQRITHQLKLRRARHPPHSTPDPRREDPPPQTGPHRTHKRSPHLASPRPLRWYPLQARPAVLPRETPPRRNVVRR